MLGPPGMLHRASHFNFSFVLSREEEAQEHFEEMLRINPMDNQGNRYILLNILLKRGMVKDAQGLLSEFKEDASAYWAYGRALLDFQRYGEGKRSKTSLMKALERNPHVPFYLLDIKQFSRGSKGYHSLGDDDEAQSHAKLALSARLTTEGALEWLGNYIQDIVEKYENQ